MKELEGALLGGGGGGELLESGGVTPQQLGVDKTTGTGATSPTDTKQPYNPYRFNHDRKHSSISMRSPIDYELTLRAADQPPINKQVAA